MTDPSTPGGPDGRPPAGPPAGGPRGRADDLRSSRGADGVDRFERLLEHLLAGRPIPVTRRGTLGQAIAVIHANFWRVLGVAIAVTVIYVAVAAALGWYRDQHVDTWTGPDASVTSGERLAGCDVTGILVDDPYFPNWVRFGGHVYVRTDTIRPFADFEVGPGNRFLETPYRDGDIGLYLIDDTPEGKERTVILLRSRGQPAGELFRQDPACA